MSRAHVNPRMLVAQRERAGIALVDAARIAGVSEDALAQAEAGEHRLTSRQARQLAGRYGCSLAYLYLAPTESGEEASRELFRRFRDVPADASASPELRSAMSDAEEVRDMALELLGLLDDEPTFSATTSRVRSVSRQHLASELRATLAVSASTQASWRNEADALRAWRLSIEQAGAIVMQAALVPRGETDPGPVRGFVLPDDRLPVIVLNRHDVEAAQVFTLIHELVHALLAASGQAQPDDERTCDRIAAEVLMPTDVFLREASSVFRIHEESQAAQRVARRFKVSMSAALVRAADLQLVSWDIVSEILASVPRTRRRGGGATRVADLEGRKVVNAYGRAYTELVLDALTARLIRFDSVPGYLRTLPAGRLSEVAEVLNRAPLV